MAEYECKTCSKKFETQESLVQHINAKHPIFNKPKKFKKYFIISALVLTIIIFSSAFYIKAQKPGQFDDFAKCLTEKGAIMYGNDFCMYTTNQRNMFGKSEKYLNYIKCINNEQLCDAKGVAKTPTWEINNQTYSGEQSFEKLSTLTGCKLK